MDNHTEYWKEVERKDPGKIKLRSGSATDESEQWLKEYCKRLHHIPALFEKGDMEKAFQAGMAHYTQGDLAGDERKRIVDDLRQWSLEDNPNYIKRKRHFYNEIADRIEEGKSGD